MSFKITLAILLLLIVGCVNATPVADGPPFPTHNQCWSMPWSDKPQWIECVIPT